MGRVARAVLTKMSGVLWVLAAVLAGYRVTHPADPCASLIVLLVGLAASGTVCGQIRERRDEHLILRVKELAEATRQPRPEQPTQQTTPAPLRRVL